MVVNAILAAIAKHGKKKEANVNIYHVASSIVNPLTLEQLFGQFYEHFKSSPRFDPYGRGTPVNVETPLKLYSNMEEFSIHLEKDIGRERAPMATYFKNSRKAETLIQKLKEYTTHMATTYKPYCFYEARFDCNKLQKLMESMCEEEKEEFGFDFQSIDWNHYIKNIHIPGLRKHVLRDNQQPVL
ncbi:fatty acyl-CoA reductase 2, chloroplastic-like [Mercurialis annua]|uniref:fatty acyl-CoA reductase 2, chloroplastic-like n=1 Tax=Mercurialis annua TaxID=3986 RepID=UPI0021601478|nr:fatty acyl-CoA reductase 2, chloroplastic-like [Mercurialis annua]